MSTERCGTDMVTVLFFPIASNELNADTRYLGEPGSRSSLIDLSLEIAQITWRTYVPYNILIINVTSLKFV